MTAALEEIEFISEKLRIAIGALFAAIESAQHENPDATIKLMIAAENADGSGDIVARMESNEFLEDVGKLVGFEKVTVEDNARMFINKYQLSQ